MDTSKISNLEVFDKELSEEEVKALHASESNIIPIPDGNEWVDVECGYDGAELEYVKLEGELIYATAEYLRRCSP